jgi:peptide subunit release factor 1 (eRF1)
MLDKLLGRAELKSRIEELEEENHHLQRQLDAESERRSEAVTERQAAEERVNRLEDRIEALEDKLDQREASESSVEFRRRESLRGDRLDAVLDRLRSVDAGREGALTAMVDEDVPDEVRDLFGDHAALVERAAPCLVCADDARLVSVALAPPLAPDAFAAWDDGFRLDESWFQPTGRLTFALVRADRFALGVYEDGDRIDLETVETDVKGSHSKGGFSQARFERRRDEQIATHLDDCREVLDKRDPDRLVVVGDREMVDEIGTDADYTATVDASGDPEEAIDDAFRSFFTTRLVVV